MKYAASSAVVQCNAPLVQRIRTLKANIRLGLSAQLGTQAIREWPASQ